MTVLCIIQARAGSSRLPEKIFAEIAGTPMLSRVVNRARAATLVDHVAIATTTAAGDDRVSEFGSSLGVPVHRGSELDVLDRFYQAVQEYDDVDRIVRITADCPFIDPEVIDLVIRAQQEGNADFAANRLPPPYPRTYPIGLDVELATRAALEAAWRDAEAPHQREHVMPFIYEHPERFTTKIVDLDEDLSDQRWTVDTPEDLALARKLADLEPDDSADWRAILAIALAHPEFGRINADSVQKTVDVIDSRWNRQ